MAYATILTVYLDSIQHDLIPNAYIRKLESVLDDALVLNGTGKVANEIREYGHSPDALDLIRRISDYEEFNTMQHTIFDVPPIMFINQYIPEFYKLIDKMNEYNDEMEKLSKFLSIK